MRTLLNNRRYSAASNRLQLESLEDRRLLSSSGLVGLADVQSLLHSSAAQVANLPAGLALQGVASHGEGKALGIGLGHEEGHGASVLAHSVEAVARLDDLPGLHLGAAKAVAGEDRLPANLEAGSRLGESVGVEVGSQRGLALGKELHAALDTSLQTSTSDNALHTTGKGNPTETSIHVGIGDTQRNMPKVDDAITGSPTSADNTSLVLDNVAEGQRTAAAAIAAAFVASVPESTSIVVGTASALVGPVAFLAGEARISALSAAAAPQPAMSQNPSNEASLTTDTATAPAAVVPSATKEAGAGVAIADDGEDDLAPMNPDSGDDVPAFEGDVLDPAAVQALAISGDLSGTLVPALAGGALSPWFFTLLALAASACEVARRQLRLERSERSFVIGA